MKPYPNLEELWRIKDEIPIEMERDPAGHRKRMRELVEREERAGRIILRNTGDVRRHAEWQEAARALVLREKAPPFDHSSP